MLEQLQQAIKNYDPQAVVAALADWSEEQREEARRPLAVWLLAMGFERNFVMAVVPGIGPDDPEVHTCRQRNKIVPMTRKDYDHAMLYVAWLAIYGVADQALCERFTSAPDYEAESAQLMADRRPPWLASWLHHVTDLESGDMTASYWCRLYQLGLVETVREEWVALVFPQQLPDAFNNATEATQHALCALPVCREAIYVAAKEPYVLFNAKEWAPLIEWMGKECLFDHERLLTELMETIHSPLNQTERNGCVILARSASKKSAGCEPILLAKLQSHWVGLLSDPQATVAAFGLSQLISVEQAKRLEPRAAVAELAAIFQHKPKGHALKAVAMLQRLAADVALKTEALSGLVVGLSHPNKDVQSSALDALTLHLTADDESVLDRLEMQLDLLAATLRPQAEQLIANWRSGAVRSEPVVSDWSEAAKQATSLTADVRKRFRVDEQLRAAAEHRLDLGSSWTSRDLRVLDSQPRLTPIETLDELIRESAAAVERCEDGDTAERIVDGIIRLSGERPDHFEAMTDSLRSRACQDIMSRPNRGLVGGGMGDAFAGLFAAWLGLADDEADEYWTWDFLPMGGFFREVAGLVAKNNAYPLLSTPTHAGGWIDPRAWVQRLLTLEAEPVEILESDLIRSLLRLMPDRRDEAWQLVASSQASPRAELVCKVALDLDEPESNIRLTGDWSPYVWIAAIRSRNAWIDLEEHLPADELADVPEALWSLPDVLKPAAYQWRSTPPGGGFGGRVDSSAFSTQPSEDNDFDQMVASMDPSQVTAGDIDQLLDRLTKQTRSEADGQGFLTAELHAMRCVPAPPYLYPYLATQWPMKLDWYWNLATKGLARRVESGSSVEERYDQFLLPLLATDQPLTPMAARALWIATASKDGNAKAMASEVWIVVMADDRCEVEQLGNAWQDVSAAGWVKLNRIAEVLTDVASVSPLHAWIVAELVETIGATWEKPPRDAAKLLEVLNECNERLGRAVSSQLEPLLLSIKSGKAKSCAKSLRSRTDAATAERDQAIALGVEARVQRALRNQ